MAQREEREMDDCTFQPNAPRRRHPRPFNRSRTVESLTADHTLLLGHTAGGEGGSCGGSGVENSRRQTTSKGGGTGEDSDFSRGVEGVGRRLFEESKRLRERRFEGGERKRMAEEEAYARTCTFKVIVT